MDFEHGNQQESLEYGSPEHFSGQFILVVFAAMGRARNLKELEIKLRANSRGVPIDPNEIARESRKAMIHGMHSFELLKFFFDVPQFSNRERRQIFVRVGEAIQFVRSKLEEEPNGTQVWDDLQEKLRCFSSAVFHDFQSRLSGIDTFGSGRITTESLFCDDFRQRLYCIQIGTIVLVLFRINGIHTIPLFFDRSESVILPKLMAILRYKKPKVVIDIISKEVFVSKISGRLHSNFQELKFFGKLRLIETSLGFVDQDSLLIGTAFSEFSILETGFGALHYVSKIYEN